MNKQEYSDLRKERARQKYEGKRNGRLLAVEYISGKSSNSPPPDNHPHLKCRCDCGNEVIIFAHNFKNTQSCGCYQDELKRSRIKHGHNRRTTGQSSTYKAWASAVQVGVIRRWRDFSNFLEDMGDKPTKKSQLRRKDTTQKHSRSNSYWLVK